mmetsp:Transcript_6704/g.20286  ORF Transcript_6704/g.20286 Transcript_6704/m.20286 type:complete len:137 (+) Transcript_6704:1779-2189(+)
MDLDGLGDDEALSCLGTCSTLRAGAWNNDCTGGQLKTDISGTVRRAGQLALDHRLSGNIPSPSNQPMRGCSFCRCASRPIVPDYAARMRVLLTLQLAFSTSHASQLKVPSVRVEMSSRWSAGGLAPAPFPSRFVAV